jgi:gliding motility-associated-like protein
LYYDPARSIKHNTMNKNLFLSIALSTAALFASAQAGGTWTTKASLTSFGGSVTWRFSGSFSIGGKGYLVAGGIGPVVYTGDVWEFDPATNAWSQKANFGGGTNSSSASFVIGNKGYICCGGNPTMQNWLWAYDAVANTWTQKTNFPGTPRAYTVAFEANGKGYCGLGLDASTNILSDMYCYDPVLDSWSAMPAFPGGARWSPAAFTIGTKGYVGMGATTNGWTVYANDLWEFDPASGAWSAKSNFPGTGRAEMSSFSKCNYGYVGTGHTGAGEFNDFWEYDAVNDAWTQLTNVPMNTRSMTAGFSIADKCYIGLGYDNFVNNTGYGDMYEWSPVANFAASDTTICQGTSISFTDQSYNHPVSWAWTFTGGTPASSANQNPNNIIYNTPGTYTASLVATDACGYTRTKTRTIMVSPVSANAGTDVSICSGSSTTLNASGGVSYSWYSIPAGFTSASQNPSVNPTTATTYIVTVTNATGCTMNDTVVVTPATVTASFNPSTVSGYAPLSVTFNNTSTGASGYQWVFGDNGTSTSTNPTWVYTDEGQYQVTLIATNSIGCMDTVTFTINVSIDYSAMWVPNVFSPNGDGLNDIFSVGSYNLKSFNAKIFNRWGELIYQWDDPAKGWDGTYDGSDVSEGVYVYVIAGMGQNDDRFDKTGHVTVLR